MDEAEFSDFVTDRWSTLVRAAVFLGASPDEAEDIAQSTLVLCCTKWELVTAADDRDAYVYRMLVNVFRSERRTARWRLRSSQPLTDQPVVDGADAALVADAVHRAMASLNRPHREVVVLRYFVQLTEAQTASVLGIPPGTVKSRLSRSLAQLSASDHLAEYAGGAR